MGSRITILKVVTPKLSDEDTLVVEFLEFLAWLRSGKFLNHLFKYEEARLLVPDLESLPKPLLAGILLRLLGRKECYFEDIRGRRQRIAMGYLAGHFLKGVMEGFRKPLLLSGIRKQVERQFGAIQTPRSLDLQASPVYLRTELSFGVKSGGSVGHIAGVLNQLDGFAGPPVFLTSDPIPTVRPDLETHVIPPTSAFWDYTEVPSLAFTDHVYRRARTLLEGRRLAFVYQRYSLNNFAGVQLARDYGVPFVLEYNGSEIWMTRNWGQRLKYEPLSERIERLNLEAATLVVVVSQPMKDELVSQGIDPAKILVNPNGVNPERYSPEVDGRAMRERLGLGESLVIGFIGTFGPWHGAEVLAEAFGRLIQENPAYRDRLRLLMIGDGMALPRVRERLSAMGVMDLAALTGLVPQEEGPAYLAACDVVASPQVPNADGTPFFGSPTKLFEYMAMGKAIVASDLDQLGEVIAHDQTGFLVRPGDVNALTEGLRTLVEDPDRRARLGHAARQEAVARYTWHAHTQRIIEALEERCR